MTALLEAGSRAPASLVHRMRPRLPSALQKGKCSALDWKTPLAAPVRWEQDAAGAPRGVPSPEMLRWHRGGTWTALRTTPRCSLMNQSVINTQRLFRYAGSMLNIHVKEQKHTERKCLRSSERPHLHFNSGKLQSKLEKAL